MDSFGALDMAFTFPMKMMSALNETLAMQLHYAKLPVPLREFRFHPTRRYRFDFCWAEQSLAAEVNGGTWIQGRHNRGSSIKAEYDKLNAAVLNGWRVLLFTGEHIKTGEALNVIEEALKHG